jgi:aspartate oxidase
LIARSALVRKESRGCHYREDFSVTHNTSAKEQGNLVDIS